MVFSFLLSILGWWFMKLCNNFIFAYPESPIINIIYGWSRICDQIGLCFFLFAPVALSKLIIFKKIFIYFFNSLIELALSLSPAASLKLIIFKKLFIYFFNSLIEVALSLSSEAFMNNVSDPIGYFLSHFLSRISLSFNLLKTTLR